MAFMKESYSSSSEGEEEGNTLVITKKSLEKAYAMINEDSSSASGSAASRIAKVCQSACLRDLGLRAAADNCSTDTPMVEMLEELRISLLEHNDSASAKILEWFLHSATKIHLPIIWRTAALLFLKRNCSQTNRDAFLEKCAGKFDPEEKARLVQTLMTFQPIATGKLSRRDSVVSISADEDDPAQISK